MNLTTLKRGIALSVLVVLWTLGVSPIMVIAFSVENIPDDAVVGDFVVGPGKVEVFLEPGESRTVDILVTNRTGQEKVFGIDIEDFVGSQTTDKTVVLLGEERGPYSLKDYITPEVSEFTLRHAERAHMPVTISVPEDAEPGGLYGSALINIVSDPVAQDPEGGAAGGASIISRIGVLFFVRVSGDVVEDGQLKEFGLAEGSSVLTETPVNFHVLFENNGNVHLNPYGLITITNISGEVVGERTIEPWFVLPNALRLRELSWDRPLLIGRYTAHAVVNRGYDDIIDEATTSFWVLPLSTIVPGVAIIVVIVLLLYLLRSKFEIRKRDNPRN